MGRLAPEAWHARTEGKETDEKEEEAKGGRKTYNGQSEADRLNSHKAKDRPHKGQEVS